MNEYEFLETCDQAGVEYREAGEDSHVSSGWVGFSCPWCRDQGEFVEGKYHLGWHAESNRWSCWKCGGHRSGDAISRILGINIGQAIQMGKGLKGHAPIEAADKRGVLRLPTGLGPFRKSHGDYIRGRGLSAAYVQEIWGLQGLGADAVRYNGKSLAHRIFIPIRLKGKTVSWVTRAIYDEPVRYRAAGASEEVYNHKTLLFGSEFCGATILVHEGPLDAMTVGPGAVALCGQGYTTAQLLKISKYATRYICFDAEESAQRRASDMVNALMPFEGQTFLVELETGKDPGEVSAKELRLLKKLVA